MTRYLIEISHEDKKSACINAVKTFYRTGSHLMTQADWGCSDDVHKAWITVEMESKDEAMMLVPPEFRRNTQIITLEKFDANLEEMMEDHDD